LPVLRSLLALLSAPRQVKWRPVRWGFAFQFIIGLVINTKVGFEIFELIGKNIKKFVHFASDGTKFVFGNDIKMDNFAFGVLPTILFQG